jgi:hypothetical protein
MSRDEYNQVKKSIESMCRAIGAKEVHATTRAGGEGWTPITSIDLWFDGHHASGSTESIKSALEAA